MTFWMMMVGYAVALLVLASLARRHSSVDEYLMADREASSLKVAAGLFTLIGGGEFVTLASLGFLFGWSGIALFVGYSLGFFFLGAIAPSLRRDSREQQFVSLPDYIHFNFGRASGLFVFAFSGAAFFSLLMLQFSAAGAVIAPFLEVRQETVIIFVGLAVVMYLVIGGFKAVLTTDVLQGLAMAVVLPLIVYLLISQPDVPSITWRGSEGTLPLLLWASLVFTGFFVAAASADVWQRAYAAKSDRSARVGFLAGGLGFILYGLVIVSVGMLARSYGVDDPDNAFVSVMTGGLSEELAGLVSLLVLCAMMSTADTEMFLIAGLVQRETRRFFPGGRISEALERVSGVQLLTVVVGLTSVVFAYFFNDLVGIYTWLLSALVVISPIVTFSLFKKASAAGMFASLLGNTIVFSLLVGSGLMTLDNLYLIALPGMGLYAIALFRERSRAS